jgi:hypothetical protein
MSALMERGLLCLTRTRGEAAEPLALVVNLACAP